MRFPSEHPLSYYPVDPYARSRTRHPSTGATSPCAFALVDADTGERVTRAAVEYNGEPAPVVRVWASHVVLSTSTGDVWINPRRFGWRIVVAPA